uniref:Uncharacterized protein n=1 Tax=Cacopsylla melanoneura TaxID=428564 RepID=A0A8D8Q2L3_9HEMI
MLNKAEYWFSANHLYINRSKTEKIVFTLRQLGNIENPLSVKLLGVHMQPNLCWDTHIEHIAGKINKHVFLLRNLSTCVSQEVLRVAYFGLIHSLLNYAVLAWGHSAVRVRAFQLQRKAVRVVAHLNYTEPCEEAFRTLKILTFPSIFIYHCLLHARTNIEQIVRNNDVHQYNTRNANLLRVPYVRLQKNQNGINFWSHKFFNKLPDSIKNLPIPLFKSSIKDLLIQKVYFNTQSFLEDEEILSVPG